MKVFKKECIILKKIRLTKLKTSPWILHIQNNLLNPSHPAAKTPAASEELNLLTFIYIIILAHAAMVADNKLVFHAVVPIGNRLIMSAAIIVNNGYPGGWDTPKSLAVAMSSPESPPGKPGYIV